VIALFPLFGFLTVDTSGPISKPAFQPNVPEFRNFSVPLFTDVFDGFLTTFPAIPIHQIRLTLINNAFLT